MNKSLCFKYECPIMCSNKVLQNLPPLHNQVCHSVCSPLDPALTRSRRGMRYIYIHKAGPLDGYGQIPLSISVSFSLRMVSPNQGVCNRILSDSTMQGTL